MSEKISQEEYEALLNELAKLDSEPKNRRYYEIGSEKFTPKKKVKPRKKKVKPTKKKRK